MEQCRTSHGSGIEDVLGKRIKALNSVLKLRGTAFCLGAIGTRSCGHTPILVENSLYRLGLLGDSQEMVWHSLWGPHAVHGWI